MKCRKKPVPGAPRCDDIDFPPKFVFASCVWYLLRSRGCVVFTTWYYTYVQLIWIGRCCTLRVPRTAHWLANSDRVEWYPTFTWPWMFLRCHVWRGIRRWPLWGSDDMKKKPEAPHLKSSIPHPKTDVSKNLNASRRIIPLPKSAKRFFSKSRLAFPTIFGVNEPRLS